jgi:hypothetical protein
MMRCFLLLAVLLLSMASARSAEHDVRSYIDGNMIYDYLVQGNGAGTAYILGIHDGIQIAQYHAPGGERLYCPRPGITGGELADVVQRYLEENPDVRGYPAVIIIVRAFVLAFPCEKS